MDAVASSSSFIVVIIIIIIIIIIVREADKKHMNGMRVEYLFFFFLFCFLKPVHEQNGEVLRLPFTRI